jgi:hypothetical protein
MNLLLTKSGNARCDEKNFLVLWVNGYMEVHTLVLWVNGYMEVHTHVNVKRTPPLSGLPRHVHTSMLPFYHNNRIPVTW